MNTIQDLVRAPIAGIETVDTAEGLRAIANEGCAAAVWERPPLPGMQAWIDRLDPDLLPEARIILRPDEVCEAVVAICDDCGTPAGPERALLADDTAALAELFARLMDTSYLRLRFDVVDTDACRRFHIDAVRARLICTYRGTGTHYGTTVDGEDPNPIFTAPTGSPLILRGTLWPETPSAGLRHRSPPIQGTGETRLLLVLDPVNGPNEDYR
ncbi:MAG: DUF1826 domain-containing protein [Pseudomonadota bacterium]